MLTQNYLQNKQKKTKNKKKQQNCKHTKNTQKKTLEHFIGETIELFMSLSKFSK